MSWKCEKCGYYCPHYQLKMTDGKCPNCNYKETGEEDIEITHLSKYSSYSSSGSYHDAWCGMHTGPWGTREEKDWRIIHGSTTEVGEVNCIKCLEKAKKYISQRLEDLK